MKEKENVFGEESVLVDNWAEGCTKNFNGKWTACKKK